MTASTNVTLWRSLVCATISDGATRRLTTKRPNVVLATPANGLTRHTKGSRMLAPTDSTPRANRAQDSNYLQIYIFGGAL